MKSPPPAKATKKQKPTFFKRFRWCIYILFMAFLVAFAFSLSTDIILNLSSRYSNRQPVQTPPPAFVSFDSQKVKDCLGRLKTLQYELIQHGHQSLTQVGSRQSFSSEWQTWSSNWQQRFESLGIECRLNEYQYDQFPQLGILAEIYRLLSYYQKIQSQLIRRLVFQSIQPLNEMQTLFSRAEEIIQ